MNGEVVSGMVAGRPGDAPARFGEADLLTALSMAIRAPSIHNSQPWRWRIRPHGLELYTDATRIRSRTANPPRSARPEPSSSASASARPRVPLG